MWRAPVKGIITTKLRPASARFLTKEKATMQINFDDPPARRGTDCIKWGYYEPDVLPMWVADMDFRSPEPILRALHERVDQGVFGYPLGASGRPEDLLDLRKTIVSWLSSRYGWEIALEDILFLPGVAAGFNLACHTMASPGGAVLVQTPVYPPFLKAPANAGQSLQEAVLSQAAGGTYEIDWDGFEEAITPETNLFILCSPHNPIGRVFKRDELEKMAEICLRRGIVICSDEIHCDLVYPGSRHISIASLDPEIAANTITLMAPTKTFNIPGLKVSFAVVQNRDLRRKFRKAGQGLVGWVNVLGLTAAQAAYGESQDWLAQLLDYLEANRDYLYNYVRDEMKGVRMAKPEGTYLTWLDFRESGIEGSPHQFFLEKARVALMDGKEFGTGGEGFGRINFGCPRSLLSEALDRMKNACARKRCQIANGKAERR
jgi:cysteine-S-conjugate beta-lyase